MTPVPCPADINTLAFSLMWKQSAEARRYGVRICAVTIRPSPASHPREPLDTCLWSVELDARGDTPDLMLHYRPSFRGQTSEVSPDRTLWVKHQTPITSGRYELREEIMRPMLYMLDIKLQEVYRIPDDPTGARGSLVILRDYAEAFLGLRGD